MSLSVVGDTVVSPLAPPSPAEPGRLFLRPEMYAWDGVVHEWVSAPPVWLGATSEQEAAYLEHYRQRRVLEDGAEARRMELMEREAEAEKEERSHAEQVPVQPPTNDVTPPRRRPSPGLARSRRSSTSPAPTTTTRRTPRAARLLVF
ncbi:Pre-mRNA-processing factor 39 [Hordeum vulgare]|nr:Pre-mRNA-processing factor 39 [Hordeum vulgare]